ncbi:signal peptidase II [Streptosporangium saharense]|uniref:Lipoprotein signal peptidase n=1 Tax=Streptosporangium saharense TaxID=1706840 RepID=A0A7W7QLJ8_9ACTN|nr:signal peptidase II [Streptosporangium saharense]MBB4915832.1 signal peptidase II [Streptosporangium saharense]
MRGLQAAGGAALTGETTVEGPGGDPRRSPRRRRVALLAALAVVVYGLDLATKTAVLRTLEGKDPLVLIPGLLQFRVIFNAGAAFSIGTGMTIVFTIIAASVVVAILRTARKLRSLPWAITLGLMLGGALGNLTDRLFRAPGGFQGHVVDFVEVFPSHFPVFNVADSAIVCGGILAVYLAWRGYQLDGTRDGAHDEQEPEIQDEEGSIDRAESRNDG